MKDIHGVDMSTLNDFVALAEESSQFDSVTHGGNNGILDTLNEDQVMQYSQNNSQEIRLQVGNFVSKALGNTNI